MTQFKDGDKIICREEFRHGPWEHECAMYDHAIDEVFEVVGTTTNGALNIAGMPGFWSADYFRLATGLEEHQSVGLPAEDRLHEANAHIECLREKIAGLEAELSKCCGTVADKPNLEKVVKQFSADVADLQAQLGFANTLVAESNDQRDAAVLAAKSLGDEVQGLRQDRRELRLNYKAIDGLVSSLDRAVSDIDLQQLSRQLGHIGEMADEQGNGADAKMCFDAAQVVDFVHRVLLDWRYGQDE